MKYTPLFAVVFLFVYGNASVINNEILRETPRIKSGDELLSAIVDDCFTADSATDCLKSKVLTYLDNVLGFSEESGRAYSSEVIDNVIFNRVGRILNKNEFKLTLPEYFFQGAQLTYRADRGLDIDLPEKTKDDSETDESGARGLLKKKLLFPVLLLLKLKMKALMPILLALVGFKAMKALILSKLAIILVVGFLVSQLLKKGGMPMAMSMAPAVEPTPPPPSTAYGPAASAPAAASIPADSYSPQWDPSSSGPYSRVWDTSSAQNVAYSAYYPGSSSSSSSSYSSPSSSSSTSSVASGSSSSSK